MPAWSSATASITTVVSGATAIAIPSPRTAIGARNVVQYGPSVPGSANSASPAAASAGPTVSIRRAPNRSMWPPTQRLSPPIRSVNGRNAAPASVAE